MNQNIANKDHRTYMEGGLLNDLRILLNSPQQEEGIENKRVDSQSHIENNHHNVEKNYQEKRNQYYLYEQYKTYEQ